MVIRRTSPSQITTRTDRPDSSVVKSDIQPSNINRKLLGDLQLRVISWVLRSDGGRLGNVVGDGCAWITWESDLAGMEGASDIL